MDPSDGYTHSSNKVSAYYVRCVRSGRLARGALGRFARSEPDPMGASGQFVTIDRETKLIWQGCAAGQTNAAAACTGSAVGSSWQAALSYCEGLSWGGFSDWRLPNRAELTGLVDVSRVNPSTDIAAFPGTPASEFWSSSSFHISIDSAWTVRFSDGLAGDFVKISSGYVRCVRPGP
jgi:hypothetical protein